jgi:hypothetical protein
MSDARQVDHRCAAQRARIARRQLGRPHRTDLATGRPRTIDEPTADPTARSGDDQHPSIRR